MAPPPSGRAAPSCIVSSRRPSCCGVGNCNCARHRQAARLGSRRFAVTGLPPIEGPYEWLRLAEDARAAFYVVPFDQDGVCSAPLTRADLLRRLAEEDLTDIFLFSHGWNNTWSAAIARYESFLTGFASLREEHPLERSFRPLLIGVFWPSAVLVAAGEEAPAIAAEAREDTYDAVAGAVGHAERERFYALVQQAQLSGEDAMELARIVVPLWGEDPGTDDLGAPGGLAAEELVEVWGRLEDAAAPPAERPFDAGSFGFGGADPNTVAAEPQAAGSGLRKFSPRVLLRGTTVWMMKDRAGRVGATGVHALLADVLAATDARVHLTGHSYGGKVVLSALCAGEVPRPVDSVLLLQGAMSRLCFASKVPGLDGPGGYRGALTRVRQPIMATFSSHDHPLTKEFHLAVRRRGDLGEAVIAAGETSRYSALGGFGPAGLDGEAQVVTAQEPGHRYIFNEMARVAGIDASRVVSGHGDVSNRWTWWMLLDQVGEA